MSFVLCIVDGVVRDPKTAFGIVGDTGLDMSDEY
jgi:hypothetical protein